MPDITPKLGLKKPLGNETVNRAAYRENLDLIDQNAASQADFDAHKNAAVLDHPDGSVTDAKIGNRTISDTSAPTADSGTLTTLLGWIGNMIKAITGKSNWRTAPVKSIEQLNTDITNHAAVAASTSVAGHVKLNTATNSTATDQAATPSAVKAAYDLAAAALPAVSYTAADVLAKIKTVDGAGSGLDADTLDGIQAISFMLKNGYYTDANNCVTAGTYALPSGAANVPSGSDGWGTLLVIAPDDSITNRLTQIFQPWNSGDVWYIRRKNGTTWSNWFTLHHSGMTVSAPSVEVKTAGDAVLWIESADPATTTYRRKAILSSPNVGGGNDWLFRQLRPSDGAVEDFFLRSGQAGDIWTTARLRNNNGVLEFYTGGAWKPVGDIQVGRLRSVSGTAGTTLNTWVTILDVNNIKGNLYRIWKSLSYENTGNSSNGNVRITIDGKTEQINDFIAWNQLAYGGDYTGVQSPFAPVPFYYQCKIEMQVTSVSSGVYCIANAEYALEIGR